MSTDICRSGLNLCPSPFNASNPTTRSPSQFRRPTSQSTSKTLSTTPCPSSTTVLSSNLKQNWLPQVSISTRSASLSQTRVFSFLATMRLLISTRLSCWWLLTRKDVVARPNGLSPQPTWRIAELHPIFPSLNHMRMGLQSSHPSLFCLLSSSFAVSKESRPRLKSVNSPWDWKEKAVLSTWQSISRNQPINLTS